MNVKLSATYDRMDIIEAIIRGERNPRRLAQLRDPRIKSALAKSLNWDLRAARRWSFTGPISTIAQLPGNRPSWTKTAATASLPLRATRRTRPASMSRTSSSNLTRIDGVDACPDSEVGTDIEMARPSMHPGWG